MFLDLFYGLRDEGVPVAMQEWMTLLEAMKRGMHGSSLLRFYHLARACLVKSETFFDAYDRVFARVFKGVEGAFDDMTDEVLKWLHDPKNFPNLSPEELAALEKLSSDELMRRFLETLGKQDERHDGGDRWVGTGGKSPYGHGGQHPTGIRVGGKSTNRSAMKVAGERRFKDYTTDRILDVRSLKVSLRRLRQLTRTGQATELDLDETIDETCKNAGEIELIFRAPRKNDVRVLLLMDVGGTMDPYHAPVSRLLTALHEERGLRELEAYYFHNCVYDAVYKSARMLRADAVPTGDLMRRLDPRWKVVFVGDAAMAPYEISETGGAIDDWDGSGEAGSVWFRRVMTHFRKVVWLNPTPRAHWGYTQSNAMIRELVADRMYPLTPDGLTEATRWLA